MTRLSFALFLLAGCAHYSPRPLDLAAGPTNHAARRLDDSTLAHVLTAAGAPAGWNAYRLAEAAWWLRPERPRTVAEVRLAETALLRAGARPDPGVNGGLEYSFSGTDGSSPWAIGAGPALTIELGGKRQARLELARAGVVAARATQAGEARAVRGRVHAAALPLVLALRALDRTQLRSALLDTLLAGTRRRYLDGTLPLREVSRAEEDKQEADVEVLHLRREVQLAEAVLAVTVGVPPQVLAAVALSLDAPASCGPHLRLGRDSLYSRALTRRPELGMALAAYLGAEAEVRLEVAGSWPDLVLGPGLLYDHGVGKWTIGFGLPALALNRRRGPIAEAEDRRAVAGQRVFETQERLLLEVDSSLALCAASEAESAALEPMYSLASIHEGLTREAYRRGETGALELTQARLLVLRAAHEREAAIARMAQAALAVEEATGDWRPPPMGGPH